jgi:hypothetical protein
MYDHERLDSLVLHEDVLVLDEDVEAPYQKG